MSAEERLNDLIEAAAHAHDIRREIKRLREIEAWALAQQSFSEGDAVAVAVDLNIRRGSGWWPYRPILAPGSTGTVWGIYLHDGVWFGMFRPDVQWSVSDYPSPHGTVYARETPTHFAMRLTSLRRRKKRDQPLTMPPEAVVR